MKRLVIRKKANWEIWIFVTAINIVPFLSTTGLLPQFIHILGLNVQSTILLIPLLISIKKWPKIKHTYYILTAVTTSYIIYKFATSCLELGFVESFTNFRYNFLGIIPFFMAIVYIHTLSKEQIIEIIRLIILLTVIEAILFIGHAVGILNIYDGLIDVMLESNVKVTRIYMGYPPMIIIVHAISIILYITSHRKIFLYISSLFLLTAFISYTRSSLGEIVIVTCLLLLFAIFRALIKITTTLKLLIAGLIVIICIYIMFPSSFSFWENRLTTTNKELKNDQGTYQFRKRLIEDAFYQTSLKNKELGGFGYRRDSTKGEYSFVQGEDTLIPPVIYCEGLIGIILRVSIVVAVLAKGFYILLRAKGKDGISIACIIIAILIAQSINYMQTTVFTKYLNIILPLIILIRLYNIKNYKMKTTLHKGSVI